MWFEVHLEGHRSPQDLQSVLFNPFRTGERASRSPARLSLDLCISNEVISGTEGSSRFDQPWSKERRFEWSCHAKPSTTPATREVTYRPHPRTLLLHTAVRGDTTWLCRSSATTDARSGHVAAIFDMGRGESHSTHISSSRSDDAMIGIKVSHVNLEYGRNRIALAIETSQLIAIRVEPPHCCEHRSCSCIAGLPVQVAWNSSQLDVLRGGV